MPLNPGECRQTPTAQGVDSTTKRRKKTRNPEGLRVCTGGEGGSWQASEINSLCKRLHRIPTWIPTNRGFLRSSVILYITTVKDTPFYFFMLPPDGWSSKPRKSRWRMTIEHAAKSYPGATPIMDTDEIRTLCETPEEQAEFDRRNMTNSWLKTPGGTPQ
jgi:hypothetical protein